MIRVIDPNVRARNNSIPHSVLPIHLLSIRRRRHESWNEEEAQKEGHDQSPHVPYVVDYIDAVVMQWGRGKSFATYGSVVRAYAWLKPKRTPSSTRTSCSTHC